MFDLKIAVTSGYTFNVLLPILNEDSLFILFFNSLFVCFSIAHDLSVCI